MDKTLTIAPSEEGSGRWPWLVLNAHGATLYACRDLQDALRCAREVLDLWVRAEHMLTKDS